MTNTTARPAFAEASVGKPAHTPDQPTDFRFNGTYSEERIISLSAWTAGQLVGRDVTAQLAWAASDLLAALEACEDLLAELESGGAENPELVQARAAIARAKGG